MLSLSFPGVAASGQTPGAVVSAAEPLVSLLASAATSLNCFTRELGFICNAAIVLFLFGQNHSNCLTCQLKKVIFINQISGSLHRYAKLFNVCPC